MVKAVNRAANIDSPTRSPASLQSKRAEKHSVSELIFVTHHIRLAEYVLRTGKRRLNNKVPVEIILAIIESSKVQLKMPPQEENPNVM